MNWILLLLLLLPTNAGAFNGVFIGGGTPVSGGASCDTVLWSNTISGTSDVDINDNEYYKYVGQPIVPTVDRTICKVEFYVSLKAGDITTKTFRAFITEEILNEMTNPVEADNSVLGDNDWGPLGTGTPVEFTWADGYTMIAGIEYAITISMDGVADASNYAELEVTPTTTAFPGGEPTTRWRTFDALSSGIAAGTQAKMVVYEN